MRAHDVVADELWAVLAPLSVPVEILYMLRGGIPGDLPPRELSCGSAMTCWRGQRERPGKKGRRPRPAKLHADKGYDDRRCRARAAARHHLRITREGVEDETKSARRRRLAIRHDRHAAFRQALPCRSGPGNAATTRTARCGLGCPTRTSPTRWRTSASAAGGYPAATRPERNSSATAASALRSESPLRPRSWCGPAAPWGNVVAIQR